MPKSRVKMAPTYRFTTVSNGSIRIKEETRPRDTCACDFQLFSSRRSSRNFGEIRSLSGFRCLLSSQVACQIDFEGRIIDHEGSNPAYRYEFGLLRFEDYLAYEWKRVIKDFSPDRGKMSGMAYNLLIDEFSKSGKPEGILIAARYSFSYYEEGGITLEENGFEVRRGFVDTSHYLRGGPIENSYVGVIVAGITPNVDEAARRAAAEFRRAGAINVALFLYD